MTEKQHIKKQLTDARRLHGHLGPFLAIGVRMGNIINRVLPENAEKHITITVPNKIPYTCTIDGIQSTTQCTIGNQKLTVQNSDSEIISCATTENPHRKLTLTTKKEVTEKLMTQIRSDAELETLAQEIVETAENELFTIE
jgi:formylmethanofuran dehydrogenase subunit E